MDEITELLKELCAEALNREDYSEVYKLSALVTRCIDIKDYIQKRA